jgi:hypothetical protein
VTIGPTHEAYTIDIATTSDFDIEQTTAAASVANSETWTFSFYAKASASNARVRAAFQPLTSGGAANGSELIGDLVVLSTTWQRISVSGATPASLTNRAKVIIRFQNSTATSETVYLRNAQFEEAASASAFHIGNETINSDPTASNGRVVFFYNPGSAPTPVKVKAIPANTDTSPTDYLVATLPNEGVTGRNALVTYANTRYFLQAEALTAGTDTATAAGGSAFSGSGSNVMETTFATVSTIATRVSTTLTTSLDPLKGKAWRLYARVGNDAASAATYTLRANVNFNDLPAVTFGCDQVDGFDVNLGVFFLDAEASNLRLVFSAAQLTGTADLYWDAFFFVPVDYSCALAGESDATPFSSASSYALLTDPARPSLYRTDGLGGGALESLTVRGPVPFVAEPGLTAVYIAQQTDTGDADDTHDLADSGSQTVGFEFSPRFHT